MKIKSSFALSIIAHLIVIATALFFIALPKPHVDEEIMLDLTMSTQSEKSTVSSESKSVAVKPLTQPVAKSQETIPVVHEELGKTAVASEPSNSVNVAKAETAVAQKMPEPVVVPAPTPKDAEEEYLDNHLGAIRDLLVKYRKYPTQALRLKQEGIVKVSFRLTSNGEVEEIRVVSGSGYELLDENARELIEKTAHYFPKPPKNIRITVPLNYGIKTK